MNPKDLEELTDFVVEDLAESGKAWYIRFISRMKHFSPPSRGINANFSQRLLKPFLN